VPTGAGRICYLDVHGVLIVYLSMCRAMIWNTPLSDSAEASSSSLLFCDEKRYNFFFLEQLVLPFKREEAEFTVDRSWYF
jgi:hypothetical protein